MSFDRRWLEDKGSEDSHGRTLWALGVCARDDLSPSRRAWATGLFLRALAPVQDFTSPRAWAFSLLALDAYCACTPQDFVALRLRALLADQLLAILTAVETPDWIWFEDVLGYDNARLPQALIATGLATGARRYVTAGLRTLRWLTRLQTASTGLFRPVGTSSFGAIRSRPHAFDQQPVEAAATIAACRAAWRVDPGDFWPREAQRAFDWFLGGNDLSQPLADPETGSCRDGLHPDRVNENRGAESVLSYLLALTDMRALTHAASERPLATSRLEMDPAQRPIPFTATLN
jgi:hypothetical protein